ncbi:hypothetical protein BT96DRAFT_1007929 [Gymnopus androsaceus JB14]|uniref:Uncharacterized protein n=1 Tax=Gymnopus androsaceus JB14 TaxID=1447944 RepID=A0A6A4GGU4_9AGAR|nr:hypothetical protein BT96DRAFT_1007929 [Gymnopus androsaceus JB14]
MARALDTVTLTTVDVENANCSMTAGYIVENPSFDLAVSVYAAALRVIGKWTLLAGRVEVTTNQRDSRSESHPATGIILSNNQCISQPLRDRPCPTSCKILPGFFCSCDFSGICCEKRTYSFSPHCGDGISTLDNCICVGATVPHGVFDRVGFGFVLKALDCELKGLEWTPPPLDASKTLDGLWEAPSLKTEGNIPSGISVIRSLIEWRPAVLRSFLSLAVTTIRQYLWSSRVPILRDRTIYMSPDVVSAIIKYANDQFPHSSETLTTGDILWAWLLKALHKRETYHLSTNSLCSIVARSKKIVHYTTFELGLRSSLPEKALQFGDA